MPVTSHRYKSWSVWYRPTYGSSTMTGTGVFRWVMRQATQGKDDGVNMRRLASSVGVSTRGDRLKRQPSPPQNEGDGPHLLTLRIKKIVRGWRAAV